MTLQELAAQVRLESGLRNNTVLSDTDLYSLINEGYMDLRDRLIIRFAYWFRAEAAFTLTSGSPGNVFDLTTLPDFQMAQGLDLTSGSPGTFLPVTMLSSYQERASYTGTFPFGQGGYDGNLGRKYWIDGDNLEVLPAQSAAGTYRLVYTPIQTMGVTAGPGVVSSLPAKLLPWSQYIVLYAAIAVKNSRNQDPSALLARYADIKQRVIDLTKQRSEGVRQAPISRNRYGIIGNGYGTGN